VPQCLGKCSSSRTIGKNRLLLRDILSYYGYEVSEARDGREGIQLARELLPELILLDLQMPVMESSKRHPPD
jgi:CheY-like chemotaxis protein